MPHSSAIQAISGAFLCSRSHPVRILESVTGISAAARTASRISAVKHSFFMSARCRNPVFKTFWRTPHIDVDYISAVIFRSLCRLSHNNRICAKKLHDVQRLIRSPSVSAFGSATKVLAARCHFRRQRNQLPIREQFPKGLSEYPAIRASISGNLNSCGPYFPAAPAAANKSSARASSSSVPTLAQRPTSFSPDTRPASSASNIHRNNGARSA